MSDNQPTPDEEQPTQGELDAVRDSYDPHVLEPDRDIDFPRISEYDPSAEPTWPDNWSLEPTERDQSAIDSGGM